MSRAPHALLAVALVTGIQTELAGQSTQGQISGTVRLSTNGKPEGKAIIYFCRLSAEGVPVATGWVESDGENRYTLPAMVAGEYRLRAQWGKPERRASEGDCFPAPPKKTTVQAQEKHELFLGVGARMELDFELRPRDEVWNSAEGSRITPTKMVVRYFGSDARKMVSGAVDTAAASRQWSGPTVSYDLDPRAIQRLPLAGRDVYGLLTLLPGVTASTAAGRGMGISVNGQRPTSSSYLLDGSENNNYLITGPLTALAPEMMQEYRVSTSSWSAEYGGSAGFLANSITAAGANDWHGVGYFNLKNDALNANTFANNANKRLRLPAKEAQFGGQAGGALVRNKLFFSSGVEQYRSRSVRTEETVTVPSPAAVRTVTSSPGPLNNLFRQFPLPTTAPGNGDVSSFAVRPPVSFDRTTGLARADAVTERRRVIVRATVNQFEWPDFAWYPYPDFTSGLSQPARNVAGQYSEMIRPGLTQEVQASWSSSGVGWDRAHPEVPTFAVAPARKGQASPLLPGSPLFYSFHNANKAVQLDGVWSWVHGAQILKFGGGAQQRQAKALSTQGESGLVTFNSLQDALLFDRPSTYWTAISRLDDSFRVPPAERTYRYRRLSLFGEDSWRVNSRLAVTAGIRWEYFGAPVNVGAPRDVVVRLGEGASLERRLSDARMEGQAAGDQALYEASRTGVSPRIGVAWRPAGELLAVRAGYGVFVDRPFDNLFNIRNNATIVSSLSCISRGKNLCEPTPANPYGYMAPPSVLFGGQKDLVFSKAFPALVVIDPRLRNGSSQNYFLAVRKQVSRSWDVEVTGIGARGRRLVTTDLVNRALSTSKGHINPDLPEILWRSNQGESHYAALSTVARYRSRRGSAQAAYTWGHSIDNQSDPLSGDFFDLGFTNATTRSKDAPQAAFSEQFNSRGDRASSDFDQRHNLVFYSWWEIPAWTARGWLKALGRDWQVSQVAVIRSGIPFTVRAAATEAVKNQRADLVTPEAVWAPSIGGKVEPGAVALLNPNAFRDPKSGVVGNSRRNGFVGPGFWNLDLSVRRTFPATFLGESGRLGVRADFFNAINHANLSNPDSFFGEPTFGQASRGRQDSTAGFPGLVPLRETPRLIQLLFKLEF